LWAFNDEQLAHVIATCPIAVIAGIGHETDFTIADFVADVRAPTPTAAAEMAVSARSDLMGQIQQCAARLQRVMRHQIDLEYQTLDNKSRRLISPLSYIRSERARLSGLQMRMKHIISSQQRSALFQFEQIRQRLGSHAPAISETRNLLQLLTRQFQHQTRSYLAGRSQQLEHLKVQLALLNPQRTLERGYAIVLDQHGHIIHRPDQIAAPGSITVKLAGGAVELGISSVQSKIN